MTMTASAASLAPPITVDGMTIGAGTWAANANDSMLILPTRTGAHDLGVAISDARNIAAAAPMRSAAAVSNTGTGKISAGTVDAPPPPNPNLRNTVTISFNSAPAGTYNVVDATLGVTLATNVAYTAGTDISYNGWTVQITYASRTGEQSAWKTGLPYAMAPTTGQDANDLHMAAGVMAVAKKIMEARSR